MIPTVVVLIIPTIFDLIIISTADSIILAMVDSIVKETAVPTITTLETRLSKSTPVDNSLEVAILTLNSGFILDQGVRDHRNLGF
jgi:hypothetical protein